MADFDMDWARADPDHAPPRDRYDTAERGASVRRDPRRQGTFALDRAVADAAIAAMGDGGNGARLNRAALGRAVRFMDGQALLADDASTIVALADVRRPDKLLAMDEVKGFLDSGQPDRPDPQCRLSTSGKDRRAWRQTTGG